MTTVRVSLSNVQGEGAVQVVGSLLPALERQTLACVGPIDLPDRGALSSYARRSAGPAPVIYHRRLPNAVSRLAECLRVVPRDDPRVPLLVLGDLPLRARARQTVFVHNTHLLARQQGISRGQAVKFAVMRAVFRRNLRYVTHAVVQTGLMRQQLVGAYPELEGRVHVVRQPPPEWLLGHPRPEPRLPGTRLRLFYPAAGYPHKNHHLLGQVTALEGVGDAVASIVLTIDRPAGPTGPVLDFAGRLDASSMRAHYAQADALLFPSLSESYGLPLVEAMWLGLPIVCAERPYARELCGDQAIYFDPLAPASALAAIRELRDRLAAGWHPDWRRALAEMPRDWDEVAQRLVSVALS